MKTTLIVLGLCLLFCVATVRALEDDRGTEPAPQPGPGSGETLGPAVGRLLIADESLRDPNFIKTVVLLLRHDQGGSMGLIVNRDTKVNVAEAIPRVEELKGLEDTVFSGGPVLPGSLVMLLRAPAKPAERNYHVFDDVYFSHDQKLLARLAQQRKEDPAGFFRVYSGHAAWAPGQLAAELAAGAWRVEPADVHRVFEIDPEDAWPESRPPDPRIWVHRSPGLSFRDRELSLTCDVAPKTEIETPSARLRGPGPDSGTVEAGP